MNPRQNEEREREDQLVSEADNLTPPVNCIPNIGAWERELGVL